jgi:hypothetical protein
MRVLDADGDSASGLGYAADFWAGMDAAAAGSAPGVHRVSLCETLQRACGQPGASGCPLASDCDPWKRQLASVAGTPEEPEVWGTCQPWVFPAPEDLPCPNCIKEPPR